MAIDSDTICKHLAEISGETISKDIKDALSDQNNLPGLKDELLELLKNCLEIKMDPGPSLAAENVWQYTGFNVFLSEIIKDVEARSKSSDVHDIHIIGVNVYIDTDVTMHGKNLAIGGEYVQFLKKADGSKIAIDLSGVAGVDGPVVTTTAKDGSNAEIIMDYPPGFPRELLSHPFFRGIPKVQVGQKLAEPGGPGDNGHHVQGASRAEIFVSRTRNPLKALTVILSVRSTFLAVREERGPMVGLQERVEMEKRG